MKIFPFFILLLKDLFANTNSKNSPNLSEFGESFYCMAVNKPLVAIPTSVDTLCHCAAAAAGTRVGFLTIRAIDQCSVIGGI